MNKVREGYKMTEIGEIPEEWEVSEIGRYIENISKKNKDLNIQHVVSVTKYNGIVDSLEYFDKQVFSKDISNYKIIKKDEFAYSTIHLNEGAIGYLKHCENAVLSPMYTVFKVRNDLVNNYFLYNLLKSNKYINIYEMLGEGSVDRRSSIPFNKFKEIKVAMPPIEEQEKISSILSTVDEQIDNIDALIEKNKELKKGLMQTLLTKGIGHTKFKNTEIGEIPEEWDVKKIGDICEVKGGKRLPKGYQLEDEDNAFPYIRVADMYMGGIRQDDIKYVPKDIVDKIKNYKISKDDLFISVAGTLGIVGQVPYELDGANLTENADKLCNIQINKLYLMKVLQSNIVQSIIEAEQTKSAQPKLALTRIKEFLIPVPSDIEQVKIASILMEVDEKIGQYKNKKQKLEELKKGLMQQLLTGMIRVTV